MNDAFSKLVHPVIDYGLDLRGKLAAGTKPDLALEQARLRDLLLSDEEAQMHPDFGAEHGVRTSTGSDGFDVTPRRMSTRFLGVRYALVCWLDELFTNQAELKNASWVQAWTENKLESQLYGTNDRAWKFWEQAKLAHAIQGDSPLECFYLCASLGFRGELRDQPDKLRSWCNQTKLRLGNVAELQFPYVTETTHRVNAQPLLGNSMFKKMAVICWVAMLIVIPLVSFALINRLAD